MQYQQNITTTNDGRATVLAQHVDEEFYALTVTDEEGDVTYVHMTRADFAALVDGLNNLLAATAPR